MALTQLAPPYPIFTDKNGDPLDNGYLYFGEVNKNPETNPIQVYYDSAFTQPAAQPLRTSNGYVMRNGSPALIYAGNQFSVTVRDKNNALVIYSPVGYGFTPGTAASFTDQITYNEGSSGAVDRVLTSRLQDSISVKDFGAVGDGVTDDTAAIQAAVDYALATSFEYPKTVYIPIGDYLVNQPILVYGQANLVGQGLSSRIVGNFAGAVLEIGQRVGIAAERTANCFFSDFNVQAGALCDIGIQWVNLQRCSIRNVKVSAGSGLKSGFMAHRIGGDVYTNDWVGLRAQGPGGADGYGLFIGNDLDLWTSGSTAFVNANTFVGVHCSGFGVGIQLDGSASGCHFLQPTTEGGTGYGIVVKGGQTNVIDTWWNENTLGCLFTQAAIKVFGGGTAPQNGTGNKLINNTRLGSSFTFEYQTYSVVENFNINVASSLDANCAYCSLLNIRVLGGGLTDNGFATSVIKGYNNSWVSYGLAGRGELVSDASGIRLENTVSGSYIAFDSAGTFGGNAKINSTLAPATNETVSIGRNVLRFLDGFIKQLRPGAGAVIWTSGAGSPEGVVTAPVGSIYTDTSGSTGTTLYIKEAGSGNTGWVAK